MTYLFYLCLAISLFICTSPPSLQASTTMHIGNSEPLSIGEQKASSFTRNEKGDRLTTVSSPKKDQSMNQQNATQNFMIYPEVYWNNGPNFQHNGKLPQKNPKPPGSHGHRPMPRKQ